MNPKFLSSEKEIMKFFRRKEFETNSKHKQMAPW